MTDDQIRAALAEVLYASSTGVGPRMAEGLAANLLPVVRRAQAAALRDAADDMPGRPGTNPAQDWLLARADALDPQQATT